MKTTTYKSKINGWIILDAMLTHPWIALCALLSTAAALSLMAYAAMQGAYSFFYGMCTAVLFYHSIFLPCKKRIRKLMGMPHLMQENPKSAAIFATIQIVGVIFMAVNFVGIVLLSGLALALPQLIGIGQVGIAVLGLTAATLMSIWDPQKLLDTIKHMRQTVRERADEARKNMHP